MGGKVDARSDVFSFSATLDEMATGTRPVQGRVGPRQTRGRATGGADAAPADRAGLPRDLERLILRCLRKNPGAATSRCSMCETSCWRSSRPGIESRSAPPGVGRRFRTAPWVAGGALLLLVAAGVVWWPGPLFPGRRCACSRSRAFTARDDADAVIGR